MKIFALRASLISILFAFLTAAHAAAVTYTIAFGAGRTTTPTGSFDYDATRAVNQQFLSFTVLDSGYVFDFTTAANNFSFNTRVGSFSTACNTPEVNDAFELLTNAACVAGAEGSGARQWQLAPGNSAAIFSFIASSGSPEASDGFEVKIQQIGGDSADFGNSFLATAVAAQPPGTSVPEPASIALMGIGLLAAIGATRRRESRAA